MGLLSRDDSRSQRTQAEKRLVRKLDFFIMTYCCAGYFFNYLDRQSFANAYVSGLREDLGLVANEYSILLSIWTAGSVIGGIPHSLIIQKVAPRIWLPLTLILWSGVTMCLAACTNFAGLCAARFFQGLLEASVYGGSMYVFGSWYTPSEVSKRAAIFTAVGQVGSLFSGVMMTAMNKSLHGNAGLTGYQWVFIINGLMGIPFAIFGFLSFPDLPETTKASYLTKEEIQLAHDRLGPRKENSHSIHWKTLIPRVLKTPHIYLLAALSVISGMLEAFAFQGMFLLWMKYNKKRFSQTAITTYPLGIQAVAIVSQIGAGMFIDKTGQRLPMVVLAAMLQLVTAILLLQPHLSDGGVFAAHYISGTSFIVNPVMYGWANTILQRTGDAAVRSVTLYTMALSGQLLYTFWGIAIYPSSDVPYWKKGAITMVVVCFAYVAIGYAVQKLDDKTRPITSDVTDEEASEEVVVENQTTKVG
ncbi:MFS general substrate transporter, partial [Aureobasidium melanogenum]